MTKDKEVCLSSTETLRIISGGVGTVPYYVLIREYSCKCMWVFSDPTVFYPCEANPEHYQENP